MLTPGGAVADCPGRIETVPSLELTREAPFMKSVFRSDARGVREFRITEKDGKREVVNATYLHPLAPADRQSAKNTVSVVYLSDPVVLETLPELGSWTSSVRVLVDGTEIAQGEAIKTFVGRDEVVLGECRYGVWKVEDVLDLGEAGTDLFVQYYAPELGVVVGSVRLDAQKRADKAVLFEQIGVGTK